MAEVVLFHHAQGLTPGLVVFADELRRAGHAVHLIGGADVAAEIDAKRAIRQGTELAAAI